MKIGVVYVGILFYSTNIDIPTTNTSSRYKNIMMTINDDDMEYVPYFEDRIHLLDKNNKYQEFNKVDDTGWIRMNLNSNFSHGNISSGEDCYYRRIGNVVYLRGLLYFIGIMPANRGFFTLPRDCCPKWNLYFNVYYSGSEENANVIILGKQYSDATGVVAGTMQASPKMTASSSYFLSLNGISFLVD